MKKGISFALVLAVMVSAFVVSFAMPASAETTKEFVIDGNLDIWYLNEADTPTTDLNYYYYESLEAYNKDPANGNGVYFFDGAQTAAEVYMAYDDTYIYVYVKCWDDDVSINPEDTSVSARSDSIEVWVDPDPNSQTTNPDGTAKDPSQFQGFHLNRADPLQADVAFRLRAADFTVGDMNNIVKENYGGVAVPDYYRNTENLMPFRFENEPREVASGDIVSSGYGLEVRIPRYDVTGGQSFFVNVACNNNRGESDEEWYALAIGSAWWLDYATANEIMYNRDGSNPFFEQSELTLSEKTMQYTESAYNAAGIAVKDAINELPTTVTTLEKAKVEGIIAQYNALDDVQKGYVQARNFDVLKAAADKLGFPLEGDPVDPGDDPVNPDNPVDPKPNEGTLGDINGDNKIDAKDALLALRISVGKYTATEAEMALADVNKDEKVDAKDALEMLKYSVGKPSCLA